MNGKHHSQALHAKEEVRVESLGAMLMNRCNQSLRSYVVQRVTYS